MSTYLMSVDIREPVGGRFYQWLLMVQTLELCICLISMLHHLHAQEYTMTSHQMSWHHYNKNTTKFMNQFQHVRRETASLCYHGNKKALWLKALRIQEELTRKQESQEHWTLIGWRRQVKLVLSVCVCLGVYQARGGMKSLLYSSS